MASGTSDLIVRLSLDTTNFEGAMSKFEGQMIKLQASCTNASTGITNFKQVTAQLQTSAQTLTDKLAAQKQKVADLEAAYEKSKAETGENSEETKKLAAQLEQAKQKVSQTEQALKLVTRQLKLSQNGFYQLGTQLENIGAKLESVGKKVSQVGQQLTTRVTTPIVALGTVCVKTFTSFDDSLKTVQATMGLVAGSSEEADRQIALLNSTAQEMGRATRYSASEAASALNYLALAGYDADEACAALPQVLALAQAGGLDLAYASDLATDAMAALGLSMDQLSNFSDQMAVTAQKSNTSVGQLGEAILTVGGTAKNLKGGTAELNAELGILANRGIKGAEGGTHLRNVILSLTNPTDKAAAQLEKLGVSVFDSSGNMRSMNDIMMDLNRSMDGMTAEQKQNIISTIFNKTDLAAVTALLDGCGDEFYELIGYIDDSEGAARQMADTMESGLGGAFRTLKSAVEGLAISFGERLAPYIQKAVEKITSVVNWLTSLDNKTKDTIIKIAAVAAAVGPVLLVGGKLITGIGKVIKNVGSVMKVISGATKVTGLLGKAMTALTGPVGIVIAVIAVLAAAFYSLYKNNEEFRNKVNAIWANICAAFEKVKAVFVSAFQTMQSWFAPIKASLERLWQTVQKIVLKLMPVFEAIAAAAGAMVAVVVAKIAGIISAIGPMIDAIVNFIDFLGNLLSAVISLFSGDWDGFTQGISDAWDSLCIALQDVWTAITNFFSTFWETLCSIAEAFGIDLGQVLSDAWTAIKTGVVTAWNAIKQWFSDTWTSIATTASTAWAAFTEWIAGVWEGIKTTATTVWNAIVAFFSTTWTNISTAASTAWTNFTAWISGVWEGIKTTAETVWNAVVTFFAGIWTSISTAANTAWTSFTEWISGVWNGISTTASTVWNGVTTFFSGVWTSISTAANTAWTSFSTWISGIWNGISTTASTVFNGIKTTISGVWTSIQTGAETAWNSFTTWIGGVWDGISSKATSVWNGVTSFFSTTWNNIKSGATTGWNSIKSGIENTWDTLKTNAFTSWRNITNAVSTAITNAKAGIVQGWTNIKNGVKGVWDSVLGVIKSPIESAKTWLQEKVNYFKGLFNFQWKLPSFKLPKINVTWNDIGWGIKLPKLSVSWNALGGIFDKPTILGSAAGLQGVGEAGAEAILPLDTLWAEMSVRLKAGMIDVMSGFMNERSTENMESLLRDLISAVRANNAESETIPAVNVENMVMANDMDAQSLAAQISAMTRRRQRGYGY